MVLGPLVENEAGILGNKRTEEENGGKKKKKRMHLKMIKKSKQENKREGKVSERKEQSSM